jgi:hypothetical protein
VDAERKENGPTPLNHPAFAAFDVPSQQITRVESEIFTPLTLPDTLAISFPRHLKTAEAAPRVSV